MEFEIGTRVVRYNESFGGLPHNTTGIVVPAASDESCYDNNTWVLWDTRPRPIAYIPSQIGISVRLAEQPNEWLDRYELI